MKEEVIKMKYTSAQANKLLKKFKEDYAALQQNEKDSFKFVAALNEDPESVRPQYDYVQMQRDMSGLERKISKVKHAINQFNVSTIIEDINNFFYANRSLFTILFKLGI